MEISRSIMIARSREDVFAYVLDARNDPKWCPKVVSVEQREGDAPGPGARYDVVHRPVPFKPARKMDYACTAWTPPAGVQWREDDGTDVLLVSYSLEELGDATRFTQRSEATLGAPRVLLPLMRIGIGHDIARQLRRLKAELEARTPSASTRVA